MYGHWEIDGFEPDDYFGFVYLITNTENGRKYVGKKQLRSRRRHKVNGRKNRKVVIKDSDWRIYTGSCDELNEDIERLGKDKFKFEILKLCKTKREWSFFEVEEQFRRKVLSALLEDGTREYYNKNIMSRWFVQDTKGFEGKQHTEETKRKISIACKGRKLPPRTPEHCKSISAFRRGQKLGPRSEEAKRKTSETLKQKYMNGWTTMKGKSLSEEHKHKLHLAMAGRRNWDELGKQHPRIGMKNSEEHRKRISEGQKQRWARSGKTSTATSGV